MTIFFKGTGTLPGRASKVGVQNYIGMFLVMIVALPDFQF